MLQTSTPVEMISDAFSFLELSSLTTSIRAHHVQILAVACAVLAVIGVVFAFAFQARKDGCESPSAIRSFGTFFYACFLKPHTGDSNGTGQQAALEGFYKAQVTYDDEDVFPELTLSHDQADVYDATRRRLLRGREDLLCLVAAQLEYKAKGNGCGHVKPIWVDVSLVKLRRAHPNPVPLLLKKN